MKKTACLTRRHKALRRTALVLVLLLLLWLTPFYHLTPGQVTRREAKDRMLEGSAEILETQYLWEDHTLRALQLSRTEESTLLILARWDFLTGWALESSSRAQPGVSLDAGFLQCSYESSQRSWAFWPPLAGSAARRSPP